MSPQLQDIENLKKFLLSKKPHVVAVAGENRYVLIFLKPLQMNVNHYWPECMRFS